MIRLGLSQVQVVVESTEWDCSYWMSLSSLNALEWQSVPLTYAWTFIQRLWQQTCWDVTFVGHCFLRYLLAEIDSWYQVSFHFLKRVCRLTVSMSGMGFLQMRLIDCYYLTFPQTCPTVCGRISEIQRHFTVVLAPVFSWFASCRQLWVALACPLRDHSGTCIAWSGCSHRNGTHHHCQYLDDVGRPELFFWPIGPLWSHWPLLGSECTMKVVRIYAWLT